MELQGQVVIQLQDLIFAFQLVELKVGDAFSPSQPQRTIHLFDLLIRLGGWATQQHHM